MCVSPVGLCDVSCVSHTSLILNTRSGFVKLNQQNLKEQNALKFSKCNNSDLFCTMYFQVVFFVELSYDVSEGLTALLDVLHTPQYSCFFAIE